MPGPLRRICRFFKSTLPRADALRLRSCRQHIAEGHEKGRAALTEATRAAYFFVVFFAAFLFFDGLRRQAARAALIAGEGGGE
jgi:hypothetical protein